LAYSYSAHTLTDGKTSSIISSTIYAFAT